MSRVKVWPLVYGLNGYNALGEEIVLTPAHPAWMDEKEAKRADRRGHVQIMVGLSTADLKTPTYQTVGLEAEEPGGPPGKKRSPPTSKPRRRTYKRRDIVAEPSRGG